MFDNRQTTTTTTRAVLNAQCSPIPQMGLVVGVQRMANLDSEWRPE